MRNFFSILSVIIFLTAFSGTLFAQDIKAKVLKSMERESEEMVEILELDESKKDELIEAKKEKFLKKHAIKKDYTSGSADYKSAMKELNKSFIKKLKEICTSEKYNQWIKYTKSKHSK
ncbi:hypothetical protein KFZ70_09250 [Tamlana fucoidanivorans]|uniref:DUF4890 domain-containing protein n=1 Tax=Allotamlana fucoidanivorans TaxID=2583814 RepID=A0A5C4SPC1_9FLAO|nr:hypothetical protein [Tamlana fucoidanivorans]TNJ46061.1 hypothetical protein FGF67_03435 [Tamlana fucoidanivorans]